ncbi:MAG: EF-P beta-lysylation protein EpmB [Gammaproteobacteria bacterium]|nr:EF-P beta-lysylation protein EpmB [Gammaproteobacteria bacterium]
MIHRTEAIWQADCWQHELASAFTELAPLFDYLKLDRKSLPASEKAAKLFKLRVPLHFAELIQKGNPTDPLLLQILPKAEELITTSGFSNDPVGDKACEIAPGLIHKYDGRLLLISSAACGINCRYCFRQHYPYREAEKGELLQQKVIEYLTHHHDIKEIILSGGDPLTLSDQRLYELTHALEKIPHLKRLRIHTRLASALPNRLTPRLVETLSSTRLQAVITLHINHPNEISTPLIYKLNQLRAAGITLLNQSVLLANINNNAETLCQLSERLFDAGVIPYYLHQLDPVQGAAHFQITDKEAIELITQVRQQLPGYLVPQLVRELEGESSKRPLF